MARQVIGNPFVNQIPTVSPTAQPVDIYERAVVKNSSLDSLASMLTRVKAKADPVIKAAEKRAAQREYQEGIQLYNDTRKSMGDAVKAGLIDEGASPYLRKGYRVSQMNTMALRYNAELEAALDRQKLYTNNDPARIEQFIDKFQTQFVASNGMAEFAPSEVAEYFSTPANKGNELFRSAWKTKHVEWQREQNYLQFESEVAETTTNLFRADMSDAETAVAMATFSTWLEGRSDAAAIDGMKNAEVLATILQGVGLAVEQTGMTEILDVFKKTKFGTAAVASSLKVQAKILDIENRSIVLENARNARADKEAEKLYETEMAVAIRASEAFFTYEGNYNDEKREDLEDSIKLLQSYTDPASLKLSVSLRKALDAYDQAALLGGQQKTTQSEINIDADLRKAKDIVAATNIIEFYAKNGFLDVNGIGQKFSLWRSQFDTSGDADLGLDFNSSTTSEGRATKELLDLVRGNEFDSSSEQFIRGVMEKNGLRLSIIAGVKKFMADNDGAFPDPNEMADIAYNLQIIIIKRLTKSGIFDPLEATSD